MSTKTMTSLGEVELPTRSPALQAEPVRTTPKVEIKARLRNLLATVLTGRLASKPASQADGNDEWEECLYGGGRSGR